MAVGEGAATGLSLKEWPLCRVQSSAAPPSVTSEMRPGVDPSPGLVRSGIKWGPCIT